MIFRRVWSSSLAVCFLFAGVLAAEDGGKPAKIESFQVPYRLTDTKHLLVRAKLNGKGPYNFILDTGAPALFVGTGVARKVGVTADGDGWGAFDRFELEGGVVLDKVKGQVADPYQLEGMNQLGLAGAELHGVLGYNVLARYKIEIDFTKDRMTWTRLNGFEPELPARMGGKAPASLNAMGGLVKVVSALVGKQEREVRLGGRLGFELAEQDGGLVIAGVLADSPAARAGVQKGDRLARFQEREVKTMADVERLAGKLAEGDEARLVVVRDGQEKPVTAKLARGF